MKFKLILLAILFYFIIESSAQITLTKECPLLFKEFKLKANYTITNNGTFDLKKYGCNSCFNSTLNASVSCEPCYSEKNGFYQNIPLNEYVVLTKTDLDFKTDKILINDELEFFRIAKNNLSLNFEDKIKLNNTIINFKKDDKACIYGTSLGNNCSILKGYVCSSTEECPGLIIQADDTDKCCDRACISQIKNQTKNETIIEVPKEEMKTKELSLSPDIYDGFFKKIIKFFSNLF